MTAAPAAPRASTSRQTASLRRRGRRAHRAVAVAVAVPGVVGLLALTACGGEADAAAPALPSASAPAGGSTAAAPTPEQTGLPSEEDVDRAWDDYRACMADFGVEVEADTGQDELVIPSVGDPGVTEEALDECEPILDAVFGGFELSPEEEAEFRESQLAFSQCMRENGFPEFPDPGTAAAEAATPPPGLDVDSPEFEESEERCLEESYGDLENLEMETQETGS